MRSGCMALGADVSLIMPMPTASPSDGARSFAISWGMRRRTCSMSRRGIAAMLFAGAAAALITACAWTPVEPYKGATPRTDTVYLSALGWHTEIGLRADTITGSLAALQRDVASASYFMLGCGERRLLLAGHPCLADLL